MLELIQYNDATSMTFTDICGQGCAGRTKIFIENNLVTPAVSVKARATSEQALKLFMSLTLFQRTVYSIFLLNFGSNKQTIKPTYLRIIFGQYLVTPTIISVPRKPLRPSMSETLPEDVEVKAVLSRII